jgi:hypothetical protein
VTAPTFTDCEGECEHNWYPNVARIPWWHCLKCGAEQRGTFEAMKERGGSDG